MKITYLLLENFVGIQKGTGREKLEIDFSESNKRIIMLLGKNGSGKTTILSMLNPFAGSNDKRKKIIMEGKEGKKEIIYFDSSENTYYQIVHLYSPKKGRNANGHEISSFFKKITEEGEVELNPNGGVRTFEALILEHFKIDSNYFLAGRIGTNVNSFIDLSSSDRKVFISKFLPDIDETENAKKIVASKISDLKKRTLALSTNIESVSIEELADEIHNYENQIEGVSYEIELNAIEIGKLEGRLNGLETLYGLVPEDFLKNVLDMNRNLTQLYSQLSSVSTDETPSVLNETRNQILANIMRLSERKKNLTEKKDTISKNISLISNSLNQMANVDEKETQRRLTLSISNKKTLEENRDQFVKFLETFPRNFEDLYDSFSQSVEYRKIFNLFNKKILRLHEDATELTEVPILIRRLPNKTSLIRDIEKNSQNISTLNSRLASLNDTLNHKNQKAVIGEFLIKTSLSPCEDEHCPYQSIVNAQTDVITDIDELKSNIEKVSESIDALTKLNEILKKIEEVVVSFERFHTEYLLKLKDELAMLNLVFEIDDDSIITLKNFINSFETAEENELNFIDFTIIDKYKEATESLYKTQENIHSIQHSIDQYTDLLSAAASVTRSFNEKKESLESLKSEVSSIRTEILSIDTSIVNHERDLSEVEKKIAVKESSGLIQEEANKLKEKIDNIMKYTNDKKELTSRREELYSVMNTNKKNLGSLRLFLNNKILKRDSYNSAQTELVEINNVMDIAKSVNYALDVTKGIPLILNYNLLFEIKTVANMLLDIIYQGTIQIEDFYMTDRDFLIPIRNNGLVTNDISELSQGEEALIKTAISFSIFSNNLSSVYNILYLDEIDSTLSEDNRRLFLNVLKKQLDLLNVEQVFIISHNNAFHTEDIGMVLLDGHTVDTSDKTFMENKDIIAEF